MVTTVTDNSPQSINTSLFSLDKEVQEIKKVTDKLTGINTEANVISVNGKQGIVELNASDVKALPDTTVIPTTTSELENTSGFITSSDSITGNAATATKAEQDADGNVITSTYATKAELDNKVDKVSGKGLSTNDFTTAEKEKLAGLSNYDDSAVKTLIATETSERKTADENLQTQITANKNAIDTLNGTGTGSVQKTVTDEIAKVVANAPEDFDTLKEISDWIDTHEDSASAMNTQIQANKNDIASLKTEVAGKADKTHTHSASDITSGTLPIARGGTGQTTQADINKAFVGELEEGTSDVTDGTMFVSSYASDNGFADTNATNVPYKRKFSRVWEYIKGKISSVLGLTASNYGGTADKAIEVVDYGDTGRIVKVGYFGPSIQNGALNYLAGYTELNGNSIKIKDVDANVVKKWLGIPIIKYVDYTTIPLTFTQFQQLAIDLSNFGPEVTPDNVLCFMTTHWSGVQVIASGDYNNTTGLRCTLTAFQAGTGTATIRCVYMV